MDKIGKLLESKGDTVYSTGRETTVLEAVEQMVDEHNLTDYVKGDYPG